MWLLRWIPDWLIYIIPLIGIVGLLSTYLIKFIPVPTIYMYKTPIQIVSAIIISVGFFLCGANWDNNTWLERVKELEAKVAQAEQQSKDANQKIDENTKTQKVKIQEKQVVVKQYIDREVVKYDNQCVIPKEFVEAHNRSAENDKQR
jgi:hypothetical protein